MKTGTHVRRDMRRGKMFPGIGVAVALAAMLVAVPDTQALTLEDAMSLAVSEHPGAA